MRPGEPVRAALIAIAHDILGEGRAALAAVERADTASAVHDYRKAMKRWRAYLRLVEPFLPPEERWLRVRARDLARQLASARDNQAALDALADLEKSEVGLSKTSFVTMRGRIEPAKEAAEASALTPQLREQLDVALAGAGHAVDAWTLQEVSFHELAGELARYYRRARDAFPAEWAEAGGEQLHEVRRCVVIHRYQMELVELLWPRLGKLWVAEAQRLRDRLGAHQDLVVLGALTAPHQPLAPWRSRIVPLIERRRAAHAAAAQRLAGRLFAEKPKAFRRRLVALWDSRGDDPAPAAE